MEEARREGFGIEEKSETGKRVEMDSKGGEIIKEGRKRAASQGQPRQKELKRRAIINFYSVVIDQINRDGRNRSFYSGPVRRSDQGYD